MKMLLKISIILLLVTSLAAAFFSMQNFNKKQEIKDRTLKLQKAVSSVANVLEHPEKDDVEKGIKSIDTMDPQIKKVVLHATFKQEEVVRLEGEIVTAQDDISGLKSDIQDVEANLDEANSNLAQAKQAQKEAEAATEKANSSVDPLKEEIAGLEDDIASMQDTIAEKEELIADNTDIVTALEKQVEDLGAELQIISEQERGGNPLKGLAGKVIEVNDEWNFIVIDLGAEDRLVESAEALVHRADQLLGKVRISQVDETMAVADVLLDWRKGSIQVGDSIAF